MAQPLCVVAPVRLDNTNVVIDVMTIVKNPTVHGNSWFVNLTHSKTGNEWGTRLVEVDPRPWKFAVGESHSFQNQE